MGGGFWFPRGYALTGKVALQKHWKHALKSDLINKICTLKHGSILNIYIYICLFLFTEYILCISMHRFMNLLLSSPKIVHLFLHTPFARKTRQKSTAAKTIKQSGVSQDRYKAIFKCKMTVRQIFVTSFAISPPSGTGFRHRRPSSIQRQMSVACPLEDRFPVALEKHPTAYHKSTHPLVFCKVLFF